MTQTTTSGGATLADRLAELIQARGLTLRELEEKTGHAVEHSSISRIISEGRDPKASTVAALAGALGVSIDYLLGLRDRPGMGGDDHIDVPLLTEPPGPDGPQETRDRWISIPRVVVGSRTPHYALWNPPDRANVPGLREGDVLLVRADAAPGDGHLIVVRTEGGYAVRQYREVDGIILAEALDGELSRLTHRDVIGVGVGVYHWM